MKKIPIAGKGGIGAHFSGLVDDLVKDTVITLDRKIKLKSPVETGRFRMSWQIGENSSPGGVAYGPISKNFVSPPQRLNYLKEKAGKAYYIHNNLPYAEPVALGVNKPPSWGGVYRSNWGLSPGWLQLLAKEAASRVKRNWNTIVKKGG